MHENYASFHHFEYWHEGGLEGVLDYRGLFPIIMAETISDQNLPRSHVW